MTQNHLKKVGFNFHRNRTISFGDSIFAVQALVISFVTSRVNFDDKRQFRAEIICINPEEELDRNKPICGLISFN